MVTPRSFSSTNISLPQTPPSVLGWEMAFCSVRGRPTNVAMEGTSFFASLIIPLLNASAARASGVEHLRGKKNTIVRKSVGKAYSLPGHVLHHQSCSQALADDCCRVYYRVEVTAFGAVPFAECENRSQVVDPGHHCLA